MTVENTLLETSGVLGSPVSGDKGRTAGGVAGDRTDETTRSLCPKVSKSFAAGIKEVPWKV